MHRSETRRPRRLRVPYNAVLIAILVLAAVLRFSGLNWDDGYYLHPDERFMVMVTVDTQWPDSVGQYFDSATSPLNPYNTRHDTFVYGTFPLFLTKAVSTLIGKDVYGQTHLAGRAISAIADTGTVFLVAWIARRFFGKPAGLLAGFLFACTVLHIQTAHYYTVDAISVFFATAAFATVVKGWDRRSLGWFATAGLMIGLAGASKPNYLIALAFLGLPVAEMIRLHGLEGLIPWQKGELRRFPVIPAVALAGFVAFWTFRIAQPYAFAGPSFWNIGLDPRWTNDLSYWRSAQSGLIDIKSSVQWVGRTPIVYILDNMVRWGMGPPLGIAALVGLVMLAVRLIGSKRWPSWWMLGMGGWCVAQIVLYGTNIAQSARYLMPIYPFLVIFGAGFLIELAKRLRRANWRPARWVGPALIGVTVVYTVFYAVAFTTLFVRPLSRVEASEWIYANVPPGSTITAEYWDDALPMRLTGEDPSEYTILTLDLYAYEGPGSDKLATLTSQLNEADYIVLSSNRIINSVPRQPERYPMASHYYEMLLNGDLGFDLVAEFQQKPELAGISFNDVDAEETYTVYEHPYVRIFRKSDRFDAQRVHDELNRALGYGGVNYLPGDPLGDQMLLSSQEQTQADTKGTWRTKFDPGSLSNRFPVIWWYLAMQVMIVPILPICWLLFRRFPDHGYALAKIFGLLSVTWIAWLLAALHLVDFSPFSIALAWLLVLLAGVLLARQHLVDMTRAWQQRWRWLVATEAIFLATFGAAAWLRSLDAAFWRLGGQDQSSFWFAIFNASTRAATFPAYDPWFSGGKLHLANWGMMPWVTLTRLTGIVPEVAWNLALASIISLTAVPLWSAASALVHHLGSSLSRAGWIALLAPLATITGAMLERSIRLDDAFISTGNPLAALFAGNLDSVTTTMPILAFAIAVVVAIAQEPVRPASMQWPFDSTTIVLIALGGMLAGAMKAASTWGFLPTLALVAVGLVARSLATTGIGHPWPVVRNTFVLTLAAGIVGVVMFWPAIRELTITQRDMMTGPVMSLPVMLATFAVPLTLVLPWILLRAIPASDSSQERDTPEHAVVMFGLVLALLVVAAALILESALLFVLAILFLIFLAAWHTYDRPGEFLLLGLIAVGIGAIAAASTVTMTADPFGLNSARYLTSITWLLLGVAIPGVVAWTIGHLRLANQPAARSGIWLWLGAVAVILIMALSTPLSAIREVRDTRAGDTRSLDATAFMTDTATAPGLDLSADRDAAEWLRLRTTGLPVVLEGVTADSQIGGRISAMTGLPTVIGWNSPERIMRPGWTELVTRRQDAVHQIYGTLGNFSSIEPLLVQYGVDYIYVGPVERALYPIDALRRFDTAVGDGKLVIVYQSGPVTIYAYQP